MLLFIFYCLQFALFIYISSQSDLLRCQCSALLEFSRSFTIISPANASLNCDMNDFPYSKAKDWEEKYQNGTNCCEWDGVTCDNTFIYVIELDLHCSGLQGNLHSNSSLFQLNHLKKLNLAMNDFNGSQISPQLGQLSNLTHLNLSHSYFRGPVPYEISYLSKLQSLDLSSYDNENVVSMQEDVWKRLVENFTDTSELVLRGVNFSSIPVPSAFTNLPSSLITLNLEKSKLQGSFPISIFNLVNLTYLNLSENNLSGFFDSNMFLKLKNLLSVNFSHNDLLTYSARNIGEEGDFHDALSNLEYLDFSYCSIGDFPTFLKQAPNLNFLDLSHNNIDGDVPKWLQDVAKDSLRFLFLSNNYLTRIELLQWSQLQFIDLSSNSLGGEIPIPPSSTRIFSVSKNNLTGGISRAFCNLNSIEILNLSRNSLTGIIPQCLGNSTGFLSVLDLEMNSFYGTMPETFLKDAVYLKTLKLGGNKLQGLLPRSLASCTQLEVLDVGDNQIEDVFPNWLESLPNLQVLVIRDNKFHGDTGSPQTENPFPRLRILDFSNNYLKGRLSTAYITRLRDMIDINMTETSQQYMDATTYYQDSIKLTVKNSEFELQRILTIFTTFDVSNNQFDGEIPQVIGNLKSLKGLNLSHNMLSGTIPPSFTKLSNLEWLDLSSNKLTGNIPSDMTILTSLEVFNVSYNQLTESIPRGNQFCTFLNSSYIGNDGLCGKPLSRECSSDNGQPSPSSTSHVDAQEEEFGWKAVVLGYVFGLMFGGSIAYFTLSTGKPWWLVKMLLKSSKLRKLYLLIQ